MKIEINGEIGWEVTAKEIKEQLETMNGDIEVQINSVGGKVFEGVEIYNALKAYDRGNITVIIQSIAASIASYIAMAGDTIKAYENTTFMIHNAQGFSMGDHRAMRKSADICESLSNIIAKVYVLKTKKSLNEIASLMDEDSFFYGEEMKDNGFVDEIISIDEEKNKDEAYALALPKIQAVLNKQDERYKGDELDKLVAKLIPQKEPKQVEDNTSKTNALKARLNLKERILHGQV